MLKLRAVRLGGPEVRDTFRAGPEDELMELWFTCTETARSPCCQPGPELENFPRRDSGVFELNDSLLHWDWSFPSSGTKYLQLPLWAHE